MCCLNHVQPTPIILHYFQALKKLMAAKRWWDGHLLYHDLRQLQDGKSCSQRRDLGHHPMTLSPYLCWSTYGKNDFFTICIGGWARRLTQIHEENHEGPSSSWLHENYIFVAQDQQIHIHQQWEEGQCELSIFISHFQPYSPYSMHMMGINDCFYELSRMAPFTWMIAWRVKALKWVEVPYI